MEGSVASPSTSVGTVPVMLTTSLESLSIPAGPYMVPLDWRRTQLSTLVNKLLSGGSAVPFDFIADGVLLRASLTEYLASAGQTAETTLHLEYVRSVLPPTYVAAFEHDDWVASVDASHESQFLTASYDGAVRVFSASDASTPKLTFSTVRAGSANPSITDARWANSERNAIVTAGMDGVVRFWILSESGSGATKKWNGEAHTQPVSSVDVATSASGSPSVLSAGWDGTLALWDDDGSSTLPNDVVEHSASGSEDDEDDDNDGDTKRKRQRVRAGARKAAATRDRLRRDPVMHVIHATGSHAKAQFQKRTGSAGRDANAAWSAAWDGSLKAWDFATGGVCTATKVRFSLSLPAETKARADTDTLHGRPTDERQGDASARRNRQRVRDNRSHGPLRLDLGYAHGRRTRCHACSRCPYRARISRPCPPNRRPSLRYRLTRWNRQDVGCAQPQACPLLSHQTCSCCSSSSGRQGARARLDTRWTDYRSWWRGP